MGEWVGSGNIIMTRTGDATTRGRTAPSYVDRQPSYVDRQPSYVDPHRDQAYAMGGMHPAHGGYARVRVREWVRVGVAELLD